jgi:MFS family permease
MDDAARTKWMEARTRLAIERSNQDAEQSLENIRAAAQATILINGGAATAVLAFLSASIGKDKFNPELVVVAGRALIGYAVGVGCAPFVIWFMNHALKLWNVSWQQVLKAPDSEVAGTREHRRAKVWYLAANLFLLGSVGGFVAGSWILANGFLHTSFVVSSPQTTGAPVAAPVPSPPPPPAEASRPAPKRQ